MVYVDSTAGRRMLHVLLPLVFGKCVQVAIIRPVPVTPVELCHHEHGQTQTRASYHTLIVQVTPLHDAVDTSCGTNLQHCQAIHALQNTLCSPCGQGPAYCKGPTLVAVQGTRSCRSPHAGSCTTTCCGSHMIAVHGTNFYRSTHAGSCTTTT